MDDKHDTQPFDMNRYLSIIIINLYLYFTKKTIKIIY